MSLRVRTARTLITLLAAGLVTGTLVHFSGCASTQSTAYHGSAARMSQVVTGTDEHGNPIGPEVIPFGSIFGFERAAGHHSTPSPGDVLTAVSPDDEVWVIARLPEQAAEPAPAPGDVVAACSGAGCMITRRPDPATAQDVEIPLPLRHTDVDGSISGFIASVKVTQQFYNPYDEKIEAVYVFPLPQDAAVSEFVMTIGERRIRGIIRQREEAEAIYREARAQGYRAALLTQERPNIFTQSVANIEPARGIDVELTYFSTLAYADGWFHFVFPMVVGPRFNPPGSTDGIGSVGRGTLASPQPTNVHYLRPGERSGHDIDLHLAIDAGVPVEELVCPTHVIEQTTISSARTEVRLAESDRIPNRDFALRYRVAGEDLKAGFMAHRGESGGHFAMMLYPPATLRDLPRRPIEMVCVVDTSGSMRGRPIELAKDASRRALKHLRPGDSFQVIRFANESSALGPAPLEATPASIARGLRYIDDLHADGGTMMINGIRASLELPQDPSRLRFVTFLTDGYIGNEKEILGAIEQRLGDARIFSFGIGSAPNRYLLHRMAKLGRGAAAFVGPDEGAAEVMDLFVERIGHAALTDVEIDWGTMQVRDLFPRRVPDLFVGRPILLTGRFEGEGRATVRVRGRFGDHPLEIPIQVDLDRAAPEHEALPKVWARMQIMELMDRATYDRDPELPHQVRELALTYGLMSAYTAFIAVDSSEITSGDHGTTVNVPVPVPAGVRYDTAVGGS